MTHAAKIDQLTLKEKAALVGGLDRWHTVPIPRLNVPSVRLSDGPNGVRGTTYFPGTPSACFPCGTGMGATWDQDLIHDAGKLMAEEAKFKGAHVILGPTINIQRSPLGGRGYESFSEDPHLSGMLAARVVQGIQSEKVGACVKHFVCNDMEDDRRGVSVEVSDRALREIYLEPFRLAVQHSLPVCFMTLYSKIRGTHLSQSRDLLEGILRNEWGWDGLIMLDWYGTYAPAESLVAGLDLEMPGPPIVRRVPQVVTSEVTKCLERTTLADRASAVLKLADFAEESGIPFDAEESEGNNTPETAALLLKISSSGIVLLKNDRAVLPLAKNAKICVVGPNAKHTSISGGGLAALNSYEVTSIYDGISEKLGQPAPFTVGAYAHKFLPPLGVHLNKEDGSVGYTAKVFLEPPATPGRKPIDVFQLRESYVRMPDYKHPEIKGLLFYVDFEGVFTAPQDGEYEFGLTAIGTAQLFIDGELVVDNKTNQRQGASFYGQGTAEEKGYFSMKKGNKYKVKIEFGTAPTSLLAVATDSLVDGPGGVGFGFAKKVDAEEELARAVELAKNSDVAVVVIGLSKEWESENFDRPNMDLPGLTNSLVQEVSKVNDNVVVVNQTGMPVEMPWVNNVAAIVQAWFGGNEAGAAVADILFGDVNPSGKMPITFPKKLKDNPAFFNARLNNGVMLYGEDVFVGYRYYEYCDKDVLFPFGFGLSYTKFEILALVVSETDLELSVTATVSNVGNQQGSEVVQVYVGQENSTVERPLKELRAFKKVLVGKGVSSQVTFVLNKKRISSYWDSRAKSWVAEKGRYVVYVGNSSNHVLTAGTFDLQASTWWLEL